VDVPDLDLLHALDYVARPAPLGKSPPAPPETLDERRGIDRVLAGEYEWVVEGVVGPVMGRFDRVVAMGRVFRVTGFVGSLTGALVQELVHRCVSPLRRASTKCSARVRYCDAETEMGISSLTSGISDLNPISIDRSSNTFEKQEQATAR